MNALTLLCDLCDANREQPLPTRNAPCLGCGACCASLRVDFSVLETDDKGGPVPSELTVPLTENLRRLRGTDHTPPRCAALAGTVGQRVTCNIYEWRPSPCREFAEHSPACEKARARHGLPAL